MGKAARVVPSGSGAAEPVRRAGALHRVHCGGCTARPTASFEGFPGVFFSLEKGGENKQSKTPLMWGKPGRSPEGQLENLPGLKPC